MIYLIRHGETASNEQRVVQRSDTPLSARGALQAERLAARLADVGLTRIIASDYRRARQTAAALAQGGT
ncbi:MAG: histidine phosphatase family protein, partial [Acidobacteriota bacterium]|nr:histidine phosphatase family protein [Acidobacteriota bacterium]